MNLVKGIGDRLKQNREEQGLTINEFAKNAGITASTYKEWEKGRQFRGGPYTQLAEVCQISLQELITGEKRTLKKSSDFLNKNWILKINTFNKESLNKK